jgi:outer membrane protein TolC
MTPRSGITAGLAAYLALVWVAGNARGEDLADAWAIALRVNQQLQSRQADSMAAGLNLAAARAARLPTVRAFAFDAFLTTSPKEKANFTSLAAGSGSGALSGLLPPSFPILGSGQYNLPFSYSTATLPLYTGGKLLRGIDAASAQVGAQRSEEFRSALDLKLTVAEAYVGVLRAQKNLEVARSSVTQLASFARDVTNRREQGMAIRSDELAAEVSLANARVNEIQARTVLDSARARYNRYLCRPLSEDVRLEELSPLAPTGDLKELAAEAARATSAAVDEAEIASLTDQAIQTRPELAGLSQQARALAAQAAQTLAAVKPQAGFTMAFLYLGSQSTVPQGIGAAAFTVDWTITDGGVSRRRAYAQRQQEIATLKRRADAADDIALEVRTRWLDLLQSRQRVPVARLAVAQSVENLGVVTDRYRQQLSNYTEVLDAENRRVQSLTNFYNALYDESLARFRLRRAVGDI